VKEIEVLVRGKELDVSQWREESLEVNFFALYTHMHCIVNESTLIEKISQVLTSGFLSSKEVETGYGEGSRDDGSNTEGTSLHPLVRVSVVRVLKKTSS